MDQPEEVFEGGAAAAVAGPILFGASAVLVLVRFCGAVTVTVVVVVALVVVRCVGWSVTVEMARRLSRDGSRVAVLVARRMTIRRAVSTLSGTPRCSSSSSAKGSATRR